jgi:hypothetical protein
MEQRSVLRLAGSASVAIIVALALAAPPSPAATGPCGKGPTDEAAIDAAIFLARQMCPCDVFAKPGPHRACVRGVVDGLVAAEALRKSCRGAVMRYANRSVCGAPEGSVTCCRTTATGRESCGIAKSAARCKAPYGGQARLGATESCWDACRPQPSATPVATATPIVTPTPEGGGVCCGCGCAPPYYYDCPGVDQCSVPAPGATTPEDCDAFDVPGRLDCEFFVTCNGSHGGIPFPYCTFVR